MYEIEKSVVYLRALQEAAQKKENIKNSFVSGADYGTPKASEGEYRAIVKDAIYEMNQQGNYGVNDYVQLMFGILITNGERIEEVEIRKKYWKSASEKGAYRSELSSLLGRDTINGFNLGELLGKECIVSIKHIDGESGKFAAIEKAIPIERKSSAQEIVI